MSTVQLLLLLLLAGCSSEPTWSWRQAPPVAAPAPVRLPPLPVPEPPQARPGPRRAAPEGPPTWSFGVPLEPPDGRILHGEGQWPAGNRNYQRALGDPRLQPASTLFFVPLGDWPRPWDARVDAMHALLGRCLAEGRVPHLSLGLRGLDMERNVEVPIDREIAHGNRYDDRIRDVARELRALGTPIFLRIGYEFSGPWNGYSPWDYPLAYRRIVELFREEGCTDVAFVWAWEASSPGDFDERGPDGWKWYPGDDVVDWFGLDLFHPTDFSPPSGRSARDERLANVERFLDMARRVRRPVTISECSAVRVGITPQELDGRRDWAAWFEPFFAFLGRYPEIKAFHYINTDWAASSSAQSNGWLDADISHNAWLARRYAEELADPVYLHRDELSLLRGWKPAPPLPEPPGGPAGRAAPAPGR